MSHCCEDETVLATQEGEPGSVSSCRCGIGGRKGLWIGLGLVAAAGGALLYFVNRERGRVEEQVKATLPLQV